MAHFEIKSRWNEGIGESSRIKIVRALQMQDPIEHLTPFGAIGGRADLRGFHDEMLRGIRGATLNCVDFSASDLSGVRMTDCTLTDALFIRASMREFIDDGNLFDACHFEHTSFRNAGIGLTRSQFLNCTFTECDFSNLRFGQAEFDQCRFESCRLKGVDFGASSFVEVAFTGKLTDVWFRGRDPFVAFTDGPAAQRRANTMTGVSFAQAELTDVTFSDNCPLSQVTLPPDGQHRWLDKWPARVEASLKEIVRWNDQYAWNYVAAYRAHSKGQSEYIINRTAIIESLGSDVGGKVFDLLLSSVE